MKIIKKISILLISVVSLALLLTKLDFENTNAFDTIATFLSITTGFTITALSIIATSSFAAHLYKLEDQSDNSKTLLHTLIEQFKTSTYIFISTIGLIIIFKFFPSSTLQQFQISGYDISVTKVLRSLIWLMTSISFFYFLNLFGLFSDFVLKTASGSHK